MTQIAMAIVNVGLIAGAVILILKGHPWWAFFLLIMGYSLKDDKC